MKIGTTRTETFSDGVIAIIITIMVLSVKFPILYDHPSRSMLLRQLDRVAPALVPYAFSFLMIGIFWINHHHMFHLLEHADETLLRLNLLFLFWMSLIPMATAFVSADPSLPEAAAAYGLVMLLTTLSFALMRRHSIRRNLVHTDENARITKRIRLTTQRDRTRTYFGTVAYALSVPLAYLSVYATYCCFVVVPLLFFMPKGIDDEKLAEKIDEKNG